MDFFGIFKRQKKVSEIEHKLDRVIFLLERINAELVSARLNK